MDVTAPELALVFFNEWYCKNGLPLKLVSDRDKLFVSKFWKALHKLTGVHLKMSSAYHPESDGSSERSNKTIVKAIRYHVQRDQKGWVRCLPLLRFQMMNSINASTGFSGFQLRMGRSPRVIPPLVPQEMPADDAETRARTVISKLLLDTEEAKDKLLMAKVQQAFHANKTRSGNHDLKIGDKVMLSTLHRRKAYRNGHDGRAAKFFLRYDGPYTIIDHFPQFSTYTLELPNSPNVFPTFHASELKPYVANDASLFPSREHVRPGPVVTAEGVEEYAVERVIDERRRGRGMQYLVRWVGYGPEEDRWLARHELDGGQALDDWLAAS